MADPHDVWIGLLQRALAFARGRVVDLLGGSYRDAAAYVTALAAEAAEPTKQRLAELAKDGQGRLAPVELRRKVLVAAAQRMAAALATSPFTLAAAGEAAAALAAVCVAMDAMVNAVAVALGGPAPNAGAAILAELEQLDGVWRGALARAGGSWLDTLYEQVLGIDKAPLAAGLRWDRGQQRLSLESAPTRHALGPLALDSATIAVAFDYRAGRLVIRVRADVAASLGEGTLLARVLPAAARVDIPGVVIALDSQDGLRLGEGPNVRLALPGGLAAPGFEVRGLTLARSPVGGRIDLTCTAAGKFGPMIAAVVEDGGLSIGLDGDRLTVRPKPPGGGGLRVGAGPVRGGGFMRRREQTGEYGAVLELKIGPIGVTAAGLIGAEPFSLVIVLGVRFVPRIELSFGFTLNAVGGLLALERRIDTAELRREMQAGAIDALMFPRDPVAAAPHILDTLARVFPVQSGGFVVGPMFEVGWGSQAGFVKARVGVLLALPDPTVLMLGAVEIGVPSADVDPRLRIVDLRGEIMCKVEADHLEVSVLLNHSRLAGYAISGDLGVLIRWAGEATFALAIGGFFPKFVPPPELAGMRRIAIDMSPPIPGIDVHATGYFAITANTVQIGGDYVIAADLGVVSGRAWIALDALFQWSPRLYFSFIIDAGITLEAYGETVAGAAFHGELSGTTPWRLVGRASIEILWWDVDFDLGPYTWGEEDTALPAAVSPAAEVARALRAPTAWTPTLPDGADRLVRLIEDATPLLVHPLGSLVVKQQVVPLETTIDRIGAAPVTAPRVHLEVIRIGELGAQAGERAYELFPPGQFQTMTADQQAARPDFERLPCGVQVAATAAVRHEPAPGSITCTWETCFPRAKQPHRVRGRAGAGRSNRAVLDHGRVATADAPRRNPYRRGGAGERIAVADTGLVAVVHSVDGSPVPGAPTGVATAIAAAWLADHGDPREMQLVATGARR